MKIVRDIARDLVEKRLWPVAAALVVALIALPLALGATGGPAGTPSPPAPAAPGAPAVGSPALIVSETPLAQKRHRKGKVRNPFRQQHVPKPTSTAGPATATGAASATPAGSGPPSTPKPSALREPAIAPPAAQDVGAAQRVYAVNAAFGRPGEQRTLRDLARLSALPSARRPLFVFLGLLADAKTAVFVVSGEARATGDGRCRPTRARCETVELKAGETEFFEIGAGTPSARQYQLDVTAIKRRAATDEVARRSHRRVSERGERLFEIARDAGVIDVDRWRFDTQRGLLVTRAKTSSR